MKKTIRHIRNHSISLRHHVKKNHKTYLLGGFSVFAIIKTFVFLFGFFSIYGVFSLANNTNTDNSYVLENETIEQDYIYQNVLEFFGFGYDSLLSEEKIFEMESLLFDSQNVDDQNTNTENYSYVVDLSSGDIVLSGSKIELDDVYTNIVSLDGKSKITINNLGKTSSLIVEDSNWDGLLLAPLDITDKREAKQGDQGLDIDFIPNQTILVGSEDSRLSLDDDTKFVISISIEDKNLSSGTLMSVYSSQDGSSWTKHEEDCILDEENMCTFETDHLTLFTIGTQGTNQPNWNNMNFINEAFWEKSPTNNQIIDALYGIGGQRSAYTALWRASGLGDDLENMNLSYSAPICRPTLVTYINPGTFGDIVVPPNTIYVLRSGNYLLNNPTAGVYVSDCSAIIGIGKVNILKDYSYNHHYSFLGFGVESIMDNISASTSNLGYYFGGGSVYETRDVTLNNVELYLSNFLGKAVFNIYNSNDVFINNCKIFNSILHVSATEMNGIRILGSNGVNINNSLFFNNPHDGINIEGSQVSINNSQSFNNGRYGISADDLSTIDVNNSQIYKNGSHGMRFNGTENIEFNNVKSFHNSSYDLSFYSNASGTYFGKNYIEKSTVGNSLKAGTAHPIRTDGTLYITPLPLNCDNVTQPIYFTGGGNLSLYNAANCNMIGPNNNFTSTTRYIGNLKYLHGNNMVNNRHVQRQEISKFRLDIMLNPSAQYSYLGGYGHRFIGESDKPSQDINPPVLLSTGNTPINGTNIYGGPYNSTFSITQHIFEPNLFFAKRKEDFASDKKYYSLYDSGLKLMMNFDKIEMLGETNTGVADFSPAKNFGSSTASWVSAGKYGGAYLFNNLSSYISIPGINVNSNQITITAWVKGVQNEDFAMIVGSREGDTVAGLISVGNKLRSMWNTVGYNIETNLTIPNNSQRHFVAMTISPSETKVYLNENVFVTGGNRGTTQSFTGATRIGRHPQDSAKRRNGSIDEVRIRNRALSTEEIKFLYRSNLSAKQDRREFITTYNGVQNRPNGRYKYGFDIENMVSDSQNNTGTNTGYVVKTNCNGVFTTSRNNKNFIDQSFWTPNRSDCDIIYALYGTGNASTSKTAYTQTWEGRDYDNCNGLTMTVVRTGVIPTIINENTIYVIQGGNYNINSPISMANCSTIISSGNVIIKKIQNIDAVFSDSKTNWIIDNVNIDGNGRSNIGINISNVSQNNTINNVDVYSNVGNGLSVIESSNYNTINNSNFYNNNSYGLNIVTQRNIINNSKIYNNKNNGLYIDGFYNTINNIQVYNNSGYGIYAGSTNNVYNNVQTYNNYSDGIRIITNTTTNVFNNLMSYNNGGKGINTQGYQVTYFGKNISFDNSGSNLFSNLLAGTNPPVGWYNGILSTEGSVSWDYMTNPLSTSDGYLLNRSGDWSSLRGQQSLYSSTNTIKYSYGSGILTQNQPVYYSGTTLMNRGSFNANNFIGSDVAKILGSLNGFSSIVTGLDLSLIGDSSNYDISKYSVFGDISTFKYNINKNTPINIVLLSGNGNKRIVTQLSGGNYFATHFQSDISLEVNLDSIPPTLTFQNVNILESQHCTLVATGVDNIALDPNPYSWSIDGIHRSSWTTNNSSGPFLRDEQQSYKLRVMLKDDAGNVTSGSASCVRNNAAPISTKLINNGPTLQENIITRTASAVDTGTTFSYRWYSGHDCSSNFLSSGSSDTTTGLLSLPGTLVRSVKVFDAQGSGGACVTNTGIWNNVNPITNIVFASGNEFSAITITGDATGNDPITYKWYDDSSCNGFLIDGKTYTALPQNEPITINYYYTATDVYGGVSICTTGSITWNNAAPISTKLINNGPTLQENIITRTASAVDTGTTFSYRWYSGHDCSSNFLSSGSSDTTTGLLSLPGTLVRSVKVFDAQGSGGACVTNTGIWNNVNPITNIVFASGNEFSAITITGDATGNDPITYKWYDDSSCNGFLIDGKTYTALPQNEPITINYYYTATDVYGGVSICTTGSITWNNVSPSAHNLYQSDDQGEEISFSASGYDPGGTNFSYQRFSGNSCEGQIISTMTNFSYTNTNSSYIVRSYKVFDAQNSGSTCAIATGVWNDTIAPTANVIYTPISGTRTSGSVIATITGFSEEIVGLNANEFVFTDNGTFTFTFSDLANNNGSVTATVNWIDIVPPNQVTLISPSSGNILDTGNVALVRNIAVDTGSGIGGYVFEIYGSGYTNTGTTTTTGINIIGLEDGVYSRKVFAYDMVGNIGVESETWNFVISRQCTLPRSGTINNGEDVIAYQTNSVACGATCIQQTRTCSDGILSGSFTQSGCVVNSCGGGGGGGGSLNKDNCKLPSNLKCANYDGIDYSDSYYDNTCCATEEYHGAAPVCDISDSKYSQEINDAFQWAYSISITNKCPISSALLDNNIKRIEAAKMMSIFAMDIFGMKPEKNKKGCDKFADLDNLSEEMKTFARTSCELNIMGLRPDGKTPKEKFDPYEYIDRAQFSTMISRMIYKEKYNIFDGEENKYTWYQKHLEKLNKEGIIKKIENPFLLEKRSWVLLILHRINNSSMVTKYHTSANLNNGMFALFNGIW